MSYYWTTHKLTRPARLVRAGAFGVHYVSAATGKPVCGVNRFSIGMTPHASETTCPSCRRIVDRKQPTGA